MFVSRSASRARALVRPSAILRSVHDDAMNKPAYRLVLVRSVTLEMVFLVYWIRFRSGSGSLVREMVNGLGHGRSSHPPTYAPPTMLVPYHALHSTSHGESEWNRENRFTGWYDVQLSQKGKSERALAWRSPAHTTHSISARWKLQTNE